MGCEKVGLLAQVLGFEGWAEEGGNHLPGTFGAPVPLVGDVKSSPTARGRMLRLERKKQGVESTVGAPTDMPGGGFKPRTRHAAVYYVTAGPHGQRSAWRARGIGLVQGRGEVGLPGRSWGRPLLCTRGEMVGAWGLRR